MDSLLIPILLLVVSYASADTNIKELEIDQFGYAFSPGYPNQYPTNTSTPYSDWLTKSKNWKKLLIVFDRYDLSPDDQGHVDIIQLCTSDQYESCLDKTDACPACVYANDLNSYWFPEWGPLFLYYRPYKAPDGSTISRNGYRATLIEVDSNAGTYFQCGMTYNISSNQGPQFFINQGYPLISSMLERCQVDIISSSGIRVRTVKYFLENNSTLTISGPDMNGNNQSMQPRGYSAGGDIMNAYFHNEVSIDYQFEQGTYEQQIYFVFYVEPFQDATPNCPIPKTVFHNQQFDITTPNYINGEIYKNYDSNLNCTFTITDVAPNSQIMLQLIELNFEPVSDVLLSSDFHLRASEIGDETNRFYTTKINVSTASVSYTTDYLGTDRGLRAKMHIIDCTCTGGNYPLSSNGTTTYRFSNPIDVSGRDRANTYCKDQTCDWYFLTSPSDNITIMFSEVDVGQLDQVLIFRDDALYGEVYEPRTDFITGASKIQISFASRVVEFDDDGLNKGVQFLIYAGDTPNIPSTSSTSPIQTTAASSTSGAVTASSTSPQSPYPTSSKSPLTDQPVSSSRAPGVPTGSVPTMESTVSTISVPVEATTKTASILSYFGLFIICALFELQNI